MNEYMIRFIDGTIKHIKADSCVFMNLPSSDGCFSSKDSIAAFGNKPVAAFFINHEMYYIITLDSVSAIRFPKSEEVNGDV